MGDVRGRRGHPSECRRRRTVARGSAPASSHPSEALYRPQSPAQWNSNVFERARPKSRPEGPEQPTNGSNNGQRELKRRSMKKWTKGYCSSAPLQLRPRSKHSLRAAHQSEPARPTWSRDVRALRRVAMGRGFRRDKTSSITVGNQWGGPAIRVSICCAPTSEELRDVVGRRRKARLELGA